MTTRALLRSLLVSATLAPGCLASEPCAANGRRVGASSLETYGDWSDDPSKLETTIQYLLR